MGRETLDAINNAIELTLPNTRVYHEDVLSAAARAAYSGHLDDDADSLKNPTLVHINNEEVIKGCLKEIKSSTKQTFTKEDHKYSIIADPQGVSYGLPLILTLTNSKEEAIFIGDNLTKYLDIRFLVAKQI